MRHDSKGQCCGCVMAWHLPLITHSANMHQVPAMCRDEDRLMKKVYIIPASCSLGEARNELVTKFIVHCSYDETLRGEVRVP